MSSAHCDGPNNKRTPSPQQTTFKLSFAIYPVTDPYPSAGSITGRNLGSRAGWEMSPRDAALASK